MLVGVLADHINTLLVTGYAWWANMFQPGIGHLVSGEWVPAALLWGGRNRKQPTAHLLPAAAAAGCNAVAQQVLWEEVPRHG